MDVRFWRRLMVAFIGMLALMLAPPGLAQVKVSTNSTSHAPPLVLPPAVTEHPIAGDGMHIVLVSNDLGMHCSDLDSRIVSILPPFNVVHAQVIQIGSTPILLTAGSVNLIYSAANNANDPALANAPVTATNGATFKNNAGEVLIATYGPLYPPGLLAAFFPTAATQHGDLGLPVPDLYQLYLGSGALSWHQATMPAVTRSTFDPNTGYPTLLQGHPYVANVGQVFRVFDPSWPLFVKFPFGYAANGTNWFAAEGIPMAPFDDAGRENPFALMRVQARDNTSGKVLATTDTVVPVSGETNCKTCHLPASYSGSNGYGTGRLTTPTLPNTDPKFGSVITWVSEEWAADINILRVHDIMHGTKLYVGFNRKTGDSPKPVLCQTCHYSPALDLAQAGPQDGNGSFQTQHESMSRVMHNSHGMLMINGAPLFPTMPPPNDPRRIPTNGQNITPFTQQTLEATCYQCHPGKRTQCLRGTMFAKAGAVCQDCHGQMTQVGNDFSRNKPGGGFILASDFYTNPQTPRVPWANEPTCGSCHTGDANSNLVGKAGTLPASDNIRLIQTFLTTDSKATPILPTNLRFAEPRVTSGPATGNPQLFRVSTGHGGVFCEGCHGSTHAEWPLADANANDNVTATQLQGHTGKLLECEACHTGSLGATLGGPHGMHPVGNKGYTAGWISAHPDFTERTGTTACKACHGVSGLGTVLATVAIDRPNLRCESGALCKSGKITLLAGSKVSCNLCHANQIH